MVQRNTWFVTLVYICRNMYYKVSPMQQPKSVAIDQKVLLQVASLLSHYICGCYHKNIFLVARENLSVATLTIMVAIGKTIFYLDIHMMNDAFRHRTIYI